MRVLERNRQETATDPCIKASRQTVITMLNAQIRHLTAAMNEAVAADPQVAHRSRLLQSMSGIGEIISPWFVCALPEPGMLEPRPVAALAGVAPHPQQSGRHTGVRHIRGGRPAVRKARAEAANSARIWNPMIQACSPI